MAEGTLENNRYVVGNTNPAAFEASKRNGLLNTAKGLHESVEKICKEEHNHIDKESRKMCFELLPIRFFFR